MIEFNLKRTRIDKISREKIISELENAAKLFDYTEFGKRDFDKIADISAATVENEFGCWNKALVSLREHLKMKNIELRPREFPTNKPKYSQQQLFDEMERIWNLTGQRPSRLEWEEAHPKINYGTYTHRFGSWTNACLKFIEYKMGGIIVVNSEQNTKCHLKNSHMIKSEDKRGIPLKLRLNVLKRDNFRCVFCGRSPATHVGVILHIDHKIPFSKGGKTEIGNLQTLCLECNIGKSNG
ncbi:MAG: HNH endonuclease [Thermoplasmata archaeon]